MIESFDQILNIVGKRLSAEQQKAVESRCATVVSAGAGSGKTTVLSLRFLSLVLDGIDSDRILTITFTKKAAAEMYERIHHYMTKASEDDQRFSFQLKTKFPSAQISTMDSFWTGIARSGCLEYGISRNFSIMEDKDREKITNRIVDSMQRNPELCDSYFFFSSLFTQGNLYGEFQNLARHLDILAEINSDDLAAGYDDFLSLYKKHLANPDLMEDIIERMASFPPEMIKKDFYIDGGDFSNSVKAFKEGRYFDMSKLVITGGKRTDEWKALKDIINCEYRPVRSSLMAYSLLESTKEDERKVAKLFSYFAREYNREKRKQGLLSFLDVQALARDILIHNKSIRTFYKNRFDYIMVDEFQDTSEEQKELLYLLSEDKNIFNERVPLASELDKKKLFFVGDDKQSIYRFRGADVSVFNALKDEVVDKMGGQWLSMGTNYRSEKSLVQHFKGVFENVFTPDQDSQYTEEEKLIEEFSGSSFRPYNAVAGEIRPGRDYDNAKPVVELSCIDSSTCNSDTMSAADSEAEYIADRIVAMVDNPEYVIADNDTLRPATYNDIAVLFRVNKIQMPIERALRRRGVPYTVVESSSSTLEGIAYDIYSFLQLIVHPEDKVSYFEILSSPFARISNEGLMFLKSRDISKAFEFIPSFENIDDQKAFDSLYSLYLSVKNSAGRESITETLEHLYYESGYRTYLLSTQYLSVYDEYFTYLWTMATQIESEGGNLVSFLDELRPLVGQSKKLEGVDIQRLGEGGVRLMTIHKSKGLEFPIVILAGSGSQTRDNDAANHFVDTKRFGSRFLLLDVNTPDKASELSDKIDSVYPMAAVFNGYNRRRVVQEYKRVLYVALTRAISHVLITGVSSSYDSLLKLYLSSIEGQDVKITSFEPYTLNEIRSRRNRSVRVERDMKWYESSDVKPSPVYHELKRGVKENSSEEWSEVQGDYERLDEFSVDGLLSKHQDLRTDFGSLVHRALELAITGHSVDSYTNPNLTDSECIKVLDEANSIASRFLSSKFYERYVKGKEVVAEERFFFPEGELVLEGSADLLVLGDEYNLVVDYKTDRIKTPDIHRGQITTYIKALTELYHKKCYGILCYVRDFSSGPVWDIDGNAIEL